MLSAQHDSVARINHPHQPPRLSCQAESIYQFQQGTACYLTSILMTYLQYSTIPKGCKLLPCKLLYYKLKQSCTNHSYYGGKKLDARPSQHLPGAKGVQWGDTILTSRFSIARIRRENSVANKTVKGKWQLEPNNLNHLTPALCAPESQLQIMPLPEQRQARG